MSLIPAAEALREEMEQSIVDAISVAYKWEPTSPGEIALRERAINQCIEILVVIRERQKEKTNGS